MRRTLFLSLFVVSCLSRNFIGKNTPQTAMDNLFSKVNFNNIISEMKGKKINVPGIVQFMGEAQSGGGKKFMELLPFKDMFTKDGFGVKNDKSEYQPNLANAAAQKMAQQANASTSSDKSKINPGTVYTADDGCETSKNASTGLITTRCPSGVTTTLNPASNETTSHDPRSGVLSYVNPANNFTISINNNTFVTTQVNTTTGQTILYNNRTGVVSVLDGLLGLSIVHDVPRNTTTITNTTSGEVRIVKILAGLFIITTLNPNRTITFDFKAQTVTFVTTINGKTTTVVEPMTDKLLAQYRVYESFPVPTPLEDVHSILETIIHPDLNKKVKGPSIALDRGIVITPDSLKAPSSSSRPTLKTVTTVTQEKTQEELDKKALIKQKVEERSKNIEKKTTTQIFNQCSNGACCDTKTGKFRPIGTTCRASECAGASVCLGVSGHCPPAPPSSHLPVGTACTGGHCHSGVCVKDTTKDRRKARVDELKAKRVAAAKKDATDSGPPVVFGLNVVMECTHGGCCDLNTGLIKPSGSRCTFSKHECFEATGTCNGYESKCGRKAMADDTLCDDGKGFCKDGTCVLSSLSAQTNTHTTHTTSTESTGAKAKADAEAKAKAKEEQTDFVSDEIATRNEELDLNMAELEAKIEKAKSRQKTIKATMMQQEQEENKRALRTMFDHIHKFVKQEHTLAKQSLYPYQTTTTKEEALDNARSGFNIHDFVQRIAEEDYRYNRETLARANEKLKANNGSYEQFPWYAAALFGVFVVAIAVIVGIVKTAKSGKKQRTIKDEEYENF